jgi:predicted nucleic acid-binding Zn ribbon protein
MPVYLYIDDRTGDVHEVVQKMNDVHEYQIDGFKLRRIFVNPKISFDTKTDAFSEKEFVEKTKNKNYTVGDLWEKSKELSEKREKKAGKDKIKEKAMEAYEKKTKKRHPSRKEKIETKDFVIET